MVNDSSGQTTGIQTNPDLRHAHDSMLDGLGQLADYFGFNKVMGQLYGTLIMSDEPLSLDDMMERLGISKASVSMNMRSLEHMGMVRQVWVRGRGGRRKYYEAETDFWQIVTSLFTGREMRDVERAITVIEENCERLTNTMDAMTEEEQRLARLYIQRMREIEMLFQFARLIISSILSQVDHVDVAEVSNIEIQ